MRVPLSWLGEYVELTLEPEALAERLTLLGMEVKGIERIGSAWTNVVVGEILEVGPHPGSAKLSLAKVAVGGGSPPLSIVCGATNIAAGQRVPVAVPGAVLPGDRRIEVAHIAGTESHGMLCSGAELGLSHDADGILIMPDDTPIGVDFADVVGDVILDVDVKPNRGDALSIIGLAREVAAATSAPLRWPEIQVDESGDATSDHLAVEVEALDLCSRFVGRYLDGMTIGASPADVQRRLVAAGVRPISNVVDASNYVMLEMGKPIHTFDAAAVHEGRIVVRTARPGERLETLDHVVRELDPEVLLIADPEGPLGIAGVMGGANSEVSGSTTTVVVESAIFDPVSIRRTAFRYALRSEASLRFEKGQEHRLARVGADRTAQLIQRWAGARAARGVVDTAPDAPLVVRIPFRPARVSRLLGMTIPSDEQRALLARVEIDTQPATEGDAVPVIAGDLSVPLTEGHDALVAVIPSHRRDLAIEADLAEEIARVRGYETVAGRLPDTEMPVYRPDPHRLTDTIRDLLSGRGWLEVVTHALLAPEDHARLGIQPADAATIVAANPVTADHSELRRSLLPGMLRALVENERQRRTDLAVFEVGSVHEWVHGTPAETPVLGLAAAGDAVPASWQEPARSFEVDDLKGLIAWLVDRIAGAAVLFTAGTPRAGVDHPGRLASVVADLGGQPIELGRVGELHPAFLAAHDAQARRVVFAELSLAALTSLVPSQRLAGAIERLPVVERDIAIEIAADRPAGEVETVIRESAGPELRELRLFDRYQGPPLAAGQVSLGYRLRFQPEEGAFGDHDVDERISTIVGALSDRLGGRLRG